MACGGSSVVKFESGLVCSDSGVLGVGDVWVDRGTLVDPLRLFYVDKRRPDVVVDCRGLVIAPGFIDIQINGAFGVDFSSLSEGGVSQSLDKVRRGLLQHGVTAFCPTLVTSSLDYYRKIVPLMGPRKGGKEGAAALGLHCEGPFISREKKGAHQESFIQNQVSPAAISAAYGESLEGVRIVTLAPELPGSVSTVKWLTEDKQVVVSLGHSVSSLAVAEEAVNNGASLITHLFNAMLPFHHRDPGLVGLLTSLKVDQNPVFFGIIADGYHTHETVLRIAFQANPRGIILVTDAIAAMGLGDGVHQLGTMTVNVSGRAARLAGTTTLAGSCATMVDCVKEMRRATSCSKGEALLAASRHPAQVLGLEKERGTVTRPGAMGDLVLLDEETMDVQATVIAGEIVWERPGSNFESRVRRCWLDQL